MQTLKKPTLLVELISFLLIFLYSYTAISKIVDHVQFQTALALSPFLRPFAFLVSWMVPITELLIVLLLLVTPYRKLGFLCSLLLLMIFNVYIAYMILFIPHLPCSCGGVISAMSWQVHMGFNIFFMIVSAVGFICKAD